MKMVLFIIALAVVIFAVGVFVGKILKYCDRNVPSPRGDKQHGCAEEGPGKATHIDS